MRILLVVHGFPPLAQGGTEIYAASHAHAFARGGDDVLVIARENDLDRPECAVRTERRNGLTIAWINNSFRKVRSFADGYANEAIGAAAMRVVDDFKPEVAHLHHLTCLSTTIVRDLAARDIPTFYTLHDYWLMCHRGQLLNTAFEVCPGPEPNGCAACLGVAGAAGPRAFAAASALRTAERHLPSALARPLRAGAMRLARTVTSPPAPGVDESRRRLEHMRGVVATITHFLAPSRHMRDRFIQFGVPADRITLAEYGFEGPAHAQRLPAPTEPTDGRPLRLGFLGSLMISKAPHVLLEACARLPAGSVTIDLFGAHTAYHGDDSYRTQLAPLLEGPGVRTHGHLAHERVFDALRRLDALVVPSVWPENSPLVIREAFLAGIPVVASRIGGIPEAVEDGVSGLLFEPGNVDDLQRALTRLLNEPRLLTALRQGIPPVRTLDADVTLTRTLYRTARRRDADQARAAAAPASARSHLAAVVLNYRSPDDTFLAVRSLLLSRRPIDTVIVVDNDDSTACGAHLRPFSDRVSYIRNASNLGFSGGMNVGIREALARGADRILLVNSDMIVAPDCVQELEETLLATPGAGIAGPVVLERHAPDRVASLGMSYQPSTGRMRHRGVRIPIASVPPARAGLVDGVSGCLMLVTRAVFDRAGFLDEDYFFSFEDLDLCLRARREGLTTVLAGRARAFHQGGRSIGAASTARLYFAARNHLLLARRASERHSGFGRSITLASILALNVAHAVRAEGGSIVSRLSAVGRGSRDYFLGRLGSGPMQ